MLLTGRALFACGGNGLLEQSSLIQNWRDVIFKPDRVRTRETDVVKELLSFKGFPQRRLLLHHQAVLQDDAEALVWMLRYNLVDLTATDDLGNTAAHLAVFHDSPRSVEDLG